MIIAGEASGDMHGARLSRSLKDLKPDVRIFGIGGKKMRAEGVDIIVDAETLSVVGITEVLSKLSVILKGMRSAKTALKKLKPDILILIDFPDFNLRMAAAAKKLGILVLYYISPQIWAWRQGRVHKIKKLVDHMAVILPFEAAFYKRHKVPVTFVGHPLLDDRTLHLPKSIKQPDPKKVVVGLLPGSRDKEVSTLLPMMLASAKILSNKINGIKFMVSDAESVKKDLVSDLVRHNGEGLDIEIDPSPIENIFQKADLLIAASGTVTLQAAVYGTPIIIVYKVSPLSYLLGKALIKVNHIGLVNLISGKEVAPELVQESASPIEVASKAFSLLVKPEQLINMRKDLIAVKNKLGGPGASHRVAKIALKMMQTV